MTKELSKKNNSEFYFVYLPEFNRYHYKYLYPQNTYNNIKKIIEDLDIPFLDLHEELFNKEKKVANLFALNQNLHLNENGYKKVADKIYEFTYK